MIAHLVCRYLLTNKDHRLTLDVTSEKLFENEIYIECHRSYQLFIVYCSMRGLQ